MRRVKGEICGLGREVTQLPTSWTHKSKAIRFHEKMSLCPFRQIGPQAALKKKLPGAEQGAEAEESL